jgi:hypothetical protein
MEQEITLFNSRSMDNQILVALIKKFLENIKG